MDLFLKRKIISEHTGAATTRWEKIQYYRNIPKSPDLSPIENVWEPLKFHHNSEPHWDEERAKQRILVYRLTAGPGRELPSHRGLAPSHPTEIWSRPGAKPGWDEMVRDIPVPAVSLILLRCF